MAGRASADRDIGPYDVIVAGGGPVGLAMACALTRFMPDLRLALVDRRPVSAVADERASAIAPGVRNVLSALGVWPAMAAAAHPISAMIITDSGAGDLARPMFLRFDGDAEDGALAHMVPNTATVSALLAGLGAGVEIAAPGAVAGFAADAAGARLTLDDGRVLTAPLVIAADGARSALRGQAGIAVLRHDYGQSGIVTTISHALPHADTAYEHFRPAGPFASLPLAGNRSSLVWTERTADAARYGAMDAAALAPVIEAAMGSSLGAVEIVAPVQVFPLSLQIARSFVGPRLALIGDAAHVVHPIAGQGLNLGLKDVAALAQTTIDAMRLGQDIGAADVLERYERLRRLDTTLMAMVTDGMNRLFSNDLAPVRAVRDLGLGLVERIDPLKALLMRGAAGRDAAGPRLLRGLPI